MESTWHRTEHIVRGSRSTSCHYYDCWWCYRSSQFPGITALCQYTRVLAHLGMSLPVPETLTFALAQPWLPAKLGCELGSGMS